MMNDEDPELPIEVRESLTVIVIGSVAAWMSLTIVKYIAYLVMK